MKLLIVLTLTGMLYACGAGDGTGLNANGQPIDDIPESDSTALHATLSSIQEHVLTPICAPCHSGNNAPAGLRMDDLETSIDNLIDVDAVANEQFKRINPGEKAELSFLFLKIIGDPQAGNQMPLGQPPLSAKIVEVFRNWIESGAPVTAEQLIVSQTKVIHKANTQRVNIALLFSQPIAQELLSKQNIELTASNDRISWHLDTSNGQFSWLSPRQLVFNNIPIDAQISKLTIKLNQANTNSVFSLSGAWLDGDKDGIPGGAYVYEYQF